MLPETFSSFFIDSFLTEYVALENIFSFIDVKLKMLPLSAEFWFSFGIMLYSIYFENNQTIICRQVFIEFIFTESSSALFLYKDNTV